MSPFVLTGRQFGVYQVQELLGAGGMGEVYRAHDTRLGRDVAIKILPQVFTADPDRLARFEREARVLASLNHPNIGAIYGLEDAEGLRALVLELVEGETLADRLRRGPVPVAEALSLARQMTDALDTAHERGIVHRDLKPANIKVTPDGAVKVLDFGLAKAAAGDGAGPDLTHSPTVTVAGTRDGVILGTAAYMSPEQARGQAVDKRTDVWAFGCVLYELFTGRAVFARETLTDSLAAIVHDEPDWTRLPGNVPPAVRGLLRRCLEKDPKRRLRDIGDARIEIDDALQAPEQRAVPVPRRSGLARPRTSWLIATCATAAAAAVAAWALRPGSDATPSIEANVIERLTYDSGLTTMPALSPDGRLLAYASDRSGRQDLDIWVQQVAGGVPLRLTDDPADDASPDFSPDGSQIIFRSERAGGGIYLASAFGGPARLMAPEGRGPRFSPDGARIAYWSGQWRGDPSGLESAVFVMSLGGGAPAPVVPGFVMAQAPVWAPDGLSVLILGRRDRSVPLAEAFDWWWVPLDDRPAVKTGVLGLPGFSGAEVAPASWTSLGVVFSLRGDLWSVPVSMSDGRTTGAARRLTAGTGEASTPTASRDGTIVFTATNDRRVILRASLAEGKDTEPPIQLYADDRTVPERASVTSDGSMIVFEQGFPKYREIWMKNVRTLEQRLIARVEDPRPFNATVSPDGTRVVYTVGSYDAGSGYVVEIAGGVPRALCEACGLHGFLSDNRHVLAEWDGQHTIGVIDVTNGSKQELVRDQEHLLDRPHASFDDHWIAFRRVVGTAAKTQVAPLVPGRPASSTQWREVQEPTNTGRPTGWTLDSHVLYLLLDTDGSRCLWAQRVDPATGRLNGAPFVVRHFHDEPGFSTSLGNPVTAEGLVYESARSTGNLWRLTTPAQ